MAKRYETTDGRYVAVAVNECWDTTGTDIVPEEVVDRMQSFGAIDGRQGVTSLNIVVSAPIG